MSRLALTTLAFLTILPAIALADYPITPEQILDNMENTINGFEDQYMEVTIAIHGSDGKTKSYDLTIWQKGDTKRLVFFTSGELKGMATLVEDPNNVHVYLPGFKKIRRVAAHNMDQSIVGSDLSNEDFANASWKIGYTAKLDHEDADSYYLLLAPNKPDEVSYSKVIMKVGKKSFFQNGIDYYNSKGEFVKKMVAGEPRDFHGVWRNTKVTFSDPRSSHSTDLIINDFKINQGLKEDMFTIRQLQIGK